MCDGFTGRWGASGGGLIRYKSMEFPEMSPCRQATDRTYRLQSDREVHKETDIGERDDS